MKFPSWLTFIIKSVTLGVVISLLMLFLVPELRHGSGLSLQWFGKKQQDRLSYYDAVSRAAPSVVNIYSVAIDYRSSIIRRQQVETTNLGSGVIMTANGYILTCLHVIQNAESIYVGLQDGHIAEAEIVGQDRFTDLAVLKIAGENMPVIPQLEDPQTRIGDVVLAIGNPYNLGQTITQGIVSRTGRNFSGRTASATSVDFIQTDAVLNEGNSGGALIDSNGYLVGINNANFRTLDNRRRVVEVDGVSFAIPYRLARRVMDDIISTGTASHVRLGFSGNTILNETGLLVDSVEPNGAAGQAGLQPGDKILSIDGQPIQNINQALDIVAYSSPGSVLELEIVRENQTLLLPVTVKGIE